MLSIGVVQLRSIYFISGRKNSHFFFPRRKKKKERLYILVLNGEKYVRKVSICGMYQCPAIETCIALKNRQKLFFFLSLSVLIDLFSFLVEF